MIQPARPHSCAQVKARLLKLNQLSVSDASAALTFTTHPECDLTSCNRQVLLAKKAKPITMRPTTDDDDECHCH
jgi:hypothetical protein